MATTAPASRAAPHAQRPVRRIVAMIVVPVVGYRLRGVEVELDARRAALIGVARRAIELHRELVAALLGAGERAEAADQVTGGAHLGDRAAGVLGHVVAVPARWRRAAGPGAAVDDREVQLARQRVRAVGIDRGGAREREHAAQVAGVLDVDRAGRGGAARPQAAGAEDGGALLGVRDAQRAGRE